MFQLHFQRLASILYESGCVNPNAVENILGVAWKPDSDEEQNNTEEVTVTGISTTSKTIE